MLVDSIPSKRAAWLPGLPFVDGMEVNRTIRLDLLVDHFTACSRRERSPKSKRTCRTWNRRTWRRGDGPIEPNGWVTTVSRFNRIGDELHSPVAHQDVSPTLVPTTRGEDACRGVPGTLADFRIGWQDRVEGTS